MMQLLTQVTCQQMVKDYGGQGQRGIEVPTWHRYSRVVRAPWGSPNSDTAGEFPAAVERSEHGQDGVPRHGETARSDVRAEFASRINSRVTRGQLGQVAVHASKATSVQKASSREAASWVRRSIRPTRESLSFPVPGDPGSDCTFVGGGPVQIAEEYPIGLRAMSVPTVRVLVF